MELKERIAKNLYELRTECGLSKAKFASKCDMARRQYSTYENGDHMPTLETLEKVAKAHNVTLSWLVRER